MVCPEEERITIFNYQSLSQHWCFWSFLVGLKVMHRSLDLSDHYQCFSQAEIRVLTEFCVYVQQDVPLFLSLFSLFPWVVFVIKYQVTN